MPPTFPRKRESRLAAIIALIALTLVRIGVAAAVPLAPDEAYYWVWSRALAPGYPDHPPMVALWIRLGTMIAGNGNLGVRLLGPLSVAVASVLLADAAECLLPGRRAGLLAATLLNATLLFGVGAVIMTPDTPLLVFWTACLWAMARLQGSGDARWWLLIGLFAGLAMDSKYTAALLWFGIVLWVVITPSLRFWLRRPMPWCGAALALLLFAPIVAWNAANDWASFSQQGGRLGHWQPANALRFLGELIASQFGLLTPLVFVFCVGGIALAALRAWRPRDPAWTLLMALSLPGAVLFTQHAFGDRVQGGWPAIIYPAAGIAATALDTARWQRMFRPAVALGFGITILVYVQAVFQPVPLPARLDPIALRLDGWDALAVEVDAARRQQDAAFVAADDYGVAAKLARALPVDVATLGVEPRWRLFALPHAAMSGRSGILVRSARRGGAPDSTDWSSITAIGEVPRADAENYLLYRVTLAANVTGAVLLPHPGR